MPLRLCHSASMITIDSAVDASSCVTGVTVAPAITCFIISRRSRFERSMKRPCWCASAPCSRTMRQASMFSSTT